MQEEFGENDALNETEESEDEHLEAKKTKLFNFTINPG
jgi:hypothetical protein